MITLKINNRTVEVEEGSTILQAAEKLGIFIPTFCHDDYGRMPAKHCSNCTEYGDCKMCSCEVEGEASLLTACNTQAEEGMVVWTESEEVKKARTDILYRMIATHPLDCMNCKKLGDCKLQKYCEMYGVDLCPIQHNIHADIHPQHNQDNRRQTSIHIGKIREKGKINGKTKGKHGPCNGRQNCSRKLAL